MAFQKPSHPLSNAPFTRAANGISDDDAHVEDRHADAERGADAPRPVTGNGTRGRRAVMPLLGGNTLALEDLRDGPVLRVEELRLDLRPAAEVVRSWRAASASGSRTPPRRALSTGR